MYARVDDITEINGADSFGGFVSTWPVVLKCVPIDRTDRVIDVITRLRIRFKVLQWTADSNTILLDHIIEHKQYALTYNMVKLVSKHKLGVGFDEDAFNTKHLTTIRGSDLSGLWRYIEDNLADYVAEVCLGIEENVNESEETVVYLLNSSVLDVALKKTVIERQRVILTDITDAPRALWEHIVTERKLRCTWQNVRAVHDHTGEIGEALAGFLNEQSNYSSLAQIKLDETSGFDKETCVSVSQALICSSKLSSNAFDAMVSVLCAQDVFPCNGLTDEKVTQLIATDLLSFTQDNYTVIREHHHSALPAFVAKHSAIFFSTLSEYDYNNEDIISLLQSDDIGLSDKARLVEGSCDIISCSTASYANLICDIVLGSKISVVLSEGLLEDVLAQGIPQDRKTNLLLAQEKYLNFDRMDTYLSLVGSPFDRLTVPRSRIIVPLSEDNEGFLQMLKKNSVISSYGEDGKGCFKVVAKYD